MKAEELSILNRFKFIKSKILKTILILMGIIRPVFLTLSYFLGAQNILFRASVFFTLFIIAVYFFIKKKYKNSAFAFIVANWIGISVAVYNSGGINSVVIFGFALPIVLSTLFFSKRFVLFLSFFTLLYLLSLSFMEFQYPDYFNEFSGRRNGYVIFSVVSIVLPIFVILYFISIIVLNFQKAQKVIVKQQLKIETDLHDAKEIVDFTKQDLGELNASFADSFLLEIPKDTLTGDFYWYLVKDNFIYVSIVDCTGHGIPGSLLSIIGKCLLKTVMHMEEPLPGQCLDTLDYIMNTQFDSNNESRFRDGMDLAFCRIDLTSNALIFSGANSAFHIFSKGEEIVLRGDKKSIGGKRRLEKGKYTDIDYQLQSGDSLYMYSDGYQDQFGGENEKKFGRRRLREKLSSIQNLPMRIQQDEMLSTFNDWKGENDQIDDVIVMGLKIK